MSTIVKPVYDILNCGPRRRFAANGKLVSNCNAQNFTRKSKIRESVEAPPGHVLVVRDSAQIEARHLAAAAGQWNIVEAFAQNRDVYSEMATVIFGRKVDRKNNPDDFIPGFIGKAVVLGCFSPDTLVLTDSGWKSIVNVASTDKLWDGEEWVCHRGLIHQGEKEVVRAYGLAATKEHQVLTGLGWKPWSDVASSDSLFLLATSGVSLPLPDGSKYIEPTVELEDITQLYDVLAVLRGLSIDKILLLANQLGVKSAQNWRGTPPVSAIGDMQKFSPMTSTANAYSTVSPQLYHDATHRIASILKITPVGVLRWLLSGDTESKVDELFSSILYHCRDGITQNSNLTALTITGIMPQVTSNFLQEQRTWQTAARSTPSRTKSLTYDIAYSGPRNRFTVATSAGPVIAHNCGYSMGWKKFQAMIRVGMLGMKGILFDHVMYDSLGASVHILNSKDIESVTETVPLNLTLDQHLLHCACAKHIITTYRNNNRDIVNFWDACGAALPYMLSGEEYEFGFSPKFTTGKERIWLPNGMALVYPHLKKEGREYTKTALTGKKVEITRLYGGLLAENITQSIARITITDAMLQMKAEGMKVVMMTHDEIVVCCPENDAEAVYKRMGEIMDVTPEWCPGITLASEGGFAHNYSK